MGRKPFKEMVGCLPQGIVTCKMKLRCKIRLRMNLLMLCWHVRMSKRSCAGGSIKVFLKFNLMLENLPGLFKLTTSRWLTIISLERFSTGCSSNLLIRVLLFRNGQSKEMLFFIFKAKLLDQSLNINLQMKMMNKQLFLALEVNS